MKCQVIFLWKVIKKIRMLSATILLSDLRVTSEMPRNWFCFINCDIFIFADQSFIDVCSQSSVTSRSVHLHHTGLIPTVYNYQQCSCVIAPADCNNTATLKFRVVDMRLHSNDNLTSCSTESRIELIGQNERKVYSCEKEQFLYGFNDFHISNENGMVLYLYKNAREYPTKVWLEVQSK